MATPTKDDEVDFSDLYAVLVEVFGVILLGYIIGRLKLIGAAESKGLGRFASLIALPAALFLNMAKLDFSAVNWWFILAIFLAKAIVFVTVIVVCLLIKRKSGIDRAALFAIFTTQSNDFAFGIPVVTSLFKSDASPGLSYGDYLFLLAPISFIFLNPIGFALMEYGKNLKSEKRKSGLKIAWIVFRGVITNPIVFMAILGMIFNPIFHHNVPGIIVKLLQVLRNAFDGVALFYLGMSMVGKFKRLPGFALLVPIFLIGVKELIIPLMAQQMNNALDKGGNLSNFAFLYGTFPTAPALLFYANKYSLATDLVATSLVLCTILSAPIIFISAHMISLTQLKESEIEGQLQTSINYVSYISMAGMVWLLFMFFLSSRFKRIMFKFDIVLVFLLFAACFSAVLSQATDHLCPDNPGVIALFWFQLVGVLGARCLSSAIAVALVLIHEVGKEKWMKVFLIMISISIGLPVVATTFLVSLGTVSKPDSNETCEAGNASFFYQHNGDGRFLYGSSQGILSTVILILCALVSILSLTRLARMHHKTRTQKSPFNDSGSANINSVATETKTVVLTSSVVGLSDTSTSSRLRHSSAVEESSLQVEISEPSRAEEEVVDSLQVGVTAEQFQSVNDETSLAPSEKRKALIVDKDPNSLDNQLVVRHVIYILYSIVSMLFGIYVSCQRFLQQQRGGVFYELQFLDGALNFGQGFVLFALFGFDKYPVLVLLLRWIRRRLFDVESLHLPPVDELDSYTVTICTTFRNQYNEKCRSELCKDRKYHLRKYRSAMVGCDLVAWLTDEGIAEDQAAAVDYGRTLLRGRVLKHVHDEHDFHDLGYFYEFCDDARERKEKKKRERQLEDPQIN
eukprot:m.119292 g.119292  ORF g.119292 m.119292 type:complete len:854 (+) comp37687_c0_seq2:132-2693(+)